MKRIYTSLALLFVLLTGCGTDDPAGAPPASSAPAAASAPDRSSDSAAIARETARLNEWFEARYEEALDFSPLQKTILGRKDDYDRVDDFSESGQDLQLEWGRQTVAELRADFDRSRLTPEAQTSYDLWIYQQEQAERARPFRRRGYMFHQLGGLHTGLPQILINFHRVDDEADMVAYIARLREAARALDQLLERAELAATEGVHAPRFAHEAVIEQSRAVTTGAPFDGDGDAPLWADANAKIDALVERGAIDAARAADLRNEARDALATRLGPSYAALIAWSQSELAQADAVATGVWKLPDGPAFYTERLANETTTSMTADELHELGLREVERIRGEMEAIKERVGFAGTLQEFFVHVREDPQHYLPNDDAGREAYLDATREHLALIERRLPEYFGLLPQAELVVKRVEAFREQPGAPQHYVQGTPDGSRPGVYYVHLIDMNQVPKPEMEVIAYHEGLPGHHMQISIAQELTGVPSFRTQVGFGAYTEGWGLYAELLAKEMGAYDDVYADFGRLSSEIWRAIRLVVDTGLHAKRWTEDEAVEYFLANSPAPPGQVRAEVRRYIVMPGQATSYKVGMLKIQELRARAEAALGEAFDIRAFHDAVLGGGAVPLSILEQRIDAWIARERA